jgi:hypothetical protein
MAEADGVVTVDGDPIEEDDVDVMEGDDSVP